MMSEEQIIELVNEIKDLDTEGLVMKIHSLAEELNEVSRLYRIAKTDSFEKAFQINKLQEHIEELKNDMNIMENELLIK